MSTAGDKHTESATGFAGLSSLVSDIDALLADVRPQLETAKTNQNSEAVAGIAAEAELPITGFRRWWKFAAGGAGLAIWALVIASQPPSNGARAKAPLPGSSSAAASNVTQRVGEEKPPIGKGRTLTAAQLRYCIAEDIRLRIGQELPSTNPEIDRYNAMIDDYNARCSGAQYAEGMLKPAQEDIERRRAFIEAEGRSRFGR